ncbi:MAG: thioredoxin family protein [Saprospiraceae bacterium]|nr:thioredoxin family protein [Saprospiraceae bacterium]
MKTYLLSFSLLLLACFSANAQLKVFDWKWSAKQISDTEFELIFETKLTDGWFTYSQFIEDGGPIPTSFNYDDLGGATLKGKVKESSTSPDNRIEKMDKIFEMQLVKFKKYYKGIQRITVPSGQTPVIKGYIEAQACDAEKCLPPDGPDFEINLADYATKSSGTDPPKPDPKADNNDTGNTDENSNTDTGNSTADNNNDTNGEPNANTPAPQLEPVKWTWEKKDLGDDLYEFTFSAKIDEGWHIYSTTIGDDGPIPTGVYFEEESKNKVEVQGEPVETTSDPANRVEGMDKVFDMNLVKFKKDYTITYKVKINDKETGIKGYIESQACDHEKCMPPSGPDFEFFGEGQLGEPGKGITVGKGGEWNPADPTIQASLKTADNCGGETQDTSNILLIFVFGFFGGLFALLTPCVFPMVPLTVSYFTKRSKTKAEGVRNGSIYALSIIVIYVTMGLIITLAFGGKALNDMSTNYIFNLFFFVLFIAFAISFFGYYDIKLPSSWANKSDAAADRGGLVGIFFMAFTLSLVSFSCTGPIIGTLLVEAADGGVVAPLMGMLGFSTALALPFGLFSAFPGWLQSLPKSGGWMNTVKVVLGFVEVGLSLKFLSKADQVEGWGLLRYETYMVLTILCLLGLAAYLFGFIRFPHDPPKPEISMGRGIFAVSVLAFSAYLGTGFMKNDRTGTYATPWVMSGLAPPACDSYVYECKCPAGLVCSKPKSLDDYEEDIKAAMTAGKEGKAKPILIDFTGNGCENCRKMEDNIWIKDKVYNLINENFVLISLYTDERTKLKQVLKTPEGKKLRNVGNMWAAFEKINFGKISQPLYVLMAPDGTVLNEPVGAIFDENKYAGFLQCGLDNFKDWQKKTGN